LIHAATDSVVGWLIDVFILQRPSGSPCTQTHPKTTLIKSRSGSHTATAKQNKTTTTITKQQKQQNNNNIKLKMFFGLSHASTASFTLSSLLAGCLLGSLLKRIVRYVAQSIKVYCLSLGKTNETERCVRVCFCYLMKTLLLFLFFIFIYFILMKVLIEVVVRVSYLLVCFFSSCLCLPLSLVLFCLVGSPG